MATQSLLQDYMKNEETCTQENVRNAEKTEENLAAEYVESTAASESKAESISYFQLYRYARCKEWALVIIGTLAALANGAGFPLLFVFFGDLASQFTDYGVFAACDFTYSLCIAQGALPPFFSEEQWNETSQIVMAEFEIDGLNVIYNLLYVSAGVLVCSSLQVICWSTAAVNLSKRIRIQYFRAILRQDISFHDATSAGELNASLTEDLKKIEDGIGDKASVSIQTVSTIIGCLVVSFLRSWKIALVNLAAAPLLGLVSGLYIKVDKIYSIKERSAYAAASKIAQEAISSIRTITAFACQDKEVERYGGNLGDAKVVGIKKGALKGSALALIRFMVFSLYGVSFWYGTTLVLDGEIQPGDFITSFFAIIYMSFSLGTLGSNLGYMSGAQVIGAKVYEIIDHIPDIDIFSDKGEKPSNFQNSFVEFKDVTFCFPTRKSVQVLKQANFVVEAGKTTALVGPSGSGKSTVIQLIERFYDPQSGTINIGGYDIRSLNVHWLRQQIGLVSQEPVLFATTIRENIRWGRSKATDEEIDEAAKKANAYDFIMKFPDKFETQVGERGSQMSGGQKQRIAIARAIVNNPTILLLDEATSALDAESESVVQTALEKASAGRTTIVIAHRLSTIFGSDKIVALDKGEVKEQGTHEHLVMLEGGIYNKLVNAQSTKRTSGGMNERDLMEENEKTSHDPDENKDHSERVSKTFSFKQTKSSRASLNKPNSESDTEDRFQKNDLGSEDGMEMKIVNGKTAKDEKDKSEYPEVSFWKIMSYNKSEWYYITLGCFFSMMAGAADPILALIFGDVLTIFTLSSEAEQLEDARFYGLMFFALGVGVAIGFAMEACFLAKSGMELTYRLRKSAFKAILRQEISYFDDPKHSTAILTNNLATDALRVQGSTGIRMGTIVRTLSSLGVAVVIAFAFSWKLTLLMLGLVPLLVLSSVIQSYTLYGKVDTAQNTAEAKAHLFSEAINNIRTVAALAKEGEIAKLYENYLEMPTRRDQRKALLSGFAYGYSQVAVFVLFAATFRFAIYLVLTDGLRFEKVFKVMMAIVYGGTAVGSSSTFVPDYGEAKQSASRIIGMIKSVPRIDANSEHGKKPAHCDGKVSFKSVTFHYPARPDHTVFRGMDLKVNSRQTIAIVGQSGSGKSTTVQLMERFYDVEEGEILLDDINIKNLNVGWLREQIGLVSQEPVLFDQSIKENILRGDCSRTPSDDEMIAAAKKANIHDFVESLPKKYETNVGESGSQLSGGQKQRVAIARALIRNPKILLLDEATSALDAESGKIVQEALDGAREGRTSIVIAHRLSAIKEADQIVVIKDGRIAEVGTHEELLASRATYYKLVNAQLSSSHEAAR